MANENDKGPKGPQGITQAEHDAALTAAVEKALADDAKLRHKDNPWDNVFSRAEFSTGDGRIFTNEKRPQDGQSKRAANVAFYFTGGVGSVAGTVYLRKAPGATVPTVEVVFASGGQFKAMITPSSDASRDALTAYRASVGDLYIKWRNAQKLAGAATTGQASKSSAVISDPSLAGESW